MISSSLMLVRLTILLQLLYDLELQSSMLNSPRIRIRAIMSPQLCRAFGFKTRTFDILVIELFQSSLEFVQLALKVQQVSRAQTLVCSKDRRIAVARYKVGECRETPELPRLTPMGALLEFYIVIIWRHQIFMLVRGAMGMRMVRERWESRMSRCARARLRRAGRRAQQRGWWRRSLLQGFCLA